MSVCLFVKMLHILVLCPVLLVVGVQTLTIDSQLGTSIEDCFERISIGDQLPNHAIYRNVSELTTRECEQICKQDKQCQAYDYGVGAKGNATCDLSNVDEKELKEKSILKRHPDYDVYVRRFQCEQSPPTPIQIQMDEPGDGPLHRPVFRPNEDESKRPLADDYLVSADLANRPDDYNSNKPDYNAPPSYGDHTPQDVPFRPERPSHNQSNQKPDPIDVLQFQDPYGKPKPGHWRPAAHSGNEPPGPYGQRPDFSKPGNTPYEPEKPNYHYIIRPNRKPLNIKPQEDTGYGQGPIQSSYGQVGSGPIGPPTSPYRPYDRPSYSYNSQYASHGQNSHNDNYIYLEINDPPNAYKPVRNRPYGQNHDLGIYGYGSYSGQNSYSQSSNSQSQYHGSITDVTGYGQNDLNRPRPVYGPQNANDQGYGTSSGYGPSKPDGYKPSDQGYGNHDMQTSGYGLKPTKKPNDQYKPSYGSNLSGYGNSGDEYGSQTSGYGSKPTNKPPYKPSYGSQGGYGNNQNDYGSQNSGYGSPSTLKPDEPYRPSYGSNQGGYGNNQDDYSSQNSGYGPRPIKKPADDTHKPAYGTNQGGYGNNQDDYSSQNGGYGSQLSQKPEKPYKPSYGTNQGGYGNNQDDYSSQNGGYGSQLSQKPEKPYKPSYGSNQGGYGNNQDDYSSQNSGYGSQPTQKPDKPYKPSYGSNQGGYGNSQDEFGSQSGYGPNPEKPNGGYNKPLHETSSNDPYQKPSQSYYSSQSDYSSQSSQSSSNQYYSSSNRPYYDNYSGYDAQKPDYNEPAYTGQGSQSQSNYGSNQDTGYGNRPAYGINDYESSTSGYGKPQKPVKPEDYTGHLGAGYGNQGNYGSSQTSHNQEYYGSQQSSQSSQSYGTSQSSYGYGQGGNNQASYGNNQANYGDNQANYGNNQANYGNNQANYGNNQASYGINKPNDQPDTAGYGNQKPTNDNHTSRPGYTDVKPVYEFESDRPSDVPSYISRPGGEVVTSRPVVIGDYGENRPGYGRDPGHAISYKGANVIDGDTLAVTPARLYKRMLMSAYYLYTSAYPFGDPCGKT